MTNLLVTGLSEEAAITSELLKEQSSKLAQLGGLQDRLAKAKRHRQRSGRNSSHDLEEGEVGGDLLFYTTIDWLEDRIKTVKGEIK